MNPLIAAALTLALFAGLPGRAAAQNQYAGMQSVAPTTLPSMTVKLVDAEQKAKKRSATVVVKVSGLKIVDPASAKEKPVNGQGHLHYRLDDGPVIATTATKLSFHELTSGLHSFTVTLAGNDHAPLAPPQTVAVTVP